MLWGSTFHPIAAACHSQPILSPSALRSVADVLTPDCDALLSVRPDSRSRRLAAARPTVGRGGADGCYTLYTTVQYSTLLLAAASATAEHLGTVWPSSHDAWGRVASHVRAESRGPARRPPRLSTAQASACENSDYEGHRDLLLESVLVEPPDIITSLCPLAS